jgi:CubicO group peptidase (beta-lactamase class C family)
MNKLTRTVCMAALLFSQAHAQSPIKEDKRLTGLDETLKGLTSTFHAAGFAVAVVHKDKVIYEKGFGYRDFEQKLPVTANTLFSIGSTTKAFTCALLGQLRQEGKLDFEQPVRRFLPELVFANSEMNEQVTLRDMMCHRTGITRYDDTWLTFPPDNKDSLLYRIRYMQPTFPLRRQWAYNNLMFFAQGMTAAKVTGKSYEENIQHRFFNRLHMDHSNFSVTAMQKQADFAWPYSVERDSVIKREAYRNIDIISPAGSINSSVRDLANWVSMWINGGVYKGDTILPETYLKEAISMQMVMDAELPSLSHPDLNFSGYGLGWMLRSYRGHYQVFHGGNIDGFTANVTYFPTDSIGIVVLANQSQSNIPQLVSSIIADRMLNLQPSDWVGEAVKKSRKSKDVAEENDTIISHPHAHHAIKDLVGTYSNKAYGKFSVVQKNDSMFVEISAKPFSLSMQHFDYDIFKLCIGGEEATRLQFMMDNEAKIVSAGMNLTGGAIVVFEKQP